MLHLCKPVHEAISNAVRRRIPGVELAWMPLYASVGAAGLALSFRQIIRVWRLHRLCALLFAAGAAVFVTGAAFLELAGFFEIIPDMRLEVMLEEYAEMAGASLILCAALTLRERIDREGASGERR